MGAAIGSGPVIGMLGLMCGCISTGLGCMCTWGLVDQCCKELNGSEMIGNTRKGYPRGETYMQLEMSCHLPITAAGPPSGTQAVTWTLNSEDASSETLCLDARVDLTIWDGYREEYALRTPELPGLVFSICSFTRPKTKNHDLRPSREKRKNITFYLHNEKLVRNLGTDCMMQRSNGALPITDYHGWLVADVPR